jgi:5-methylcytosine-specific restriction endonuclease McrA
VLNADFRPLSYFPLSLLSWQDAITAVFKDHVSVLAEYDKWVSSPSTKIRLPSVVALRDYIPMPKRLAFTRFNVFLRDRFDYRRPHQFTRVFTPVFNVKCRGS